MDQRTVLVICADHDLEDLVTSAFVGIPLLVASDGESAIDVLWDGSPAAVVVDFDMPRMGGYDVLRHLSMRRPELLERTIVLIDPDDGTLPLIEDVPVGCRAPKPLDMGAFGDVALRIVGASSSESSPVAG